MANEFKNVVFSKNFDELTNDEKIDLEEAYINHNPTTKAPKNKFFKSGQKEGQKTPAYLKWEKANMNKPDFRTTPIDGTVLTSKLKQAQLTKYKDNRSKDPTKMKKGFSISHGIIRSQPTSRQTFTFDRHQGSFTKQIKQYLQNKKGVFVIKSLDSNLFNAQVQLKGNWKNDRIKIQEKIAVGSSGEIFGVEFSLSGKTTHEIEILNFNNVKFTPRKGTQIYAENKTNTCIIDPIETYVDAKNPSKNKDKLIKRLANIKKKFSDGLTNEQIQTKICNSLEVGVDIFDIMGNVTEKFRPLNKAGETQKTSKVFGYVNTRFNHAEAWAYTDFDNKDKHIITIDSADKMTDIFNDLKGKEEFTFKRSQRIQGSDHLAFIQTKNEHYKLVDPLAEERNEFYKKYGFIHLEDANVDNQIIDFIHNGTYVNGICDFNVYNEGNHIYEHDINKAYATFGDCKYYDEYKFPSIPTDFRQCYDVDVMTVISKVGWTQVYDVQGNGSNAFELSGLKNNQVRPNPELKCLWDMGVRFKCSVTAWALEKFDFKFDENLLECVNHPDYKDQKKYAIICGSWLGLYKTRKTNFSYVKEPCQEWIDNLNYYNENMKFVYNNTYEKELIIEQENDTIRSLNHIGSYITAYVRCRMYEQINKYDRADIYFVRSDAIKIKGDYELPEGFKIKDEDIKLHDDGIYNDFVNEKDIIQPDGWDCGEWADYGKIVVYTGEGGAGKTHHFINDKGFVFKSLALPTNQLKVNKQKETSINCYTHHALVGLPVFCEKDQKTKDTHKMTKASSSNYCVDECPMRQKDELKQIIKDSPHRLILMGDIDKDTGMTYQLNPIKQVFSHFFYLIKDADFVHFDKNYRVKDEKFLIKLRKIRSVMKKYYNPFGQFHGGKDDREQNLFKLNQYIVNLFADRCCSYEDVYKHYDEDDIVICPTNRVKDIYNKYFDENGLNHDWHGVEIKSFVKKWTMTEKNPQHAKGETVKGQCKYKNKKLGFASTIHAVQGKTFTNKLFVDCNNCFEWGMLYTAISRLTTEENLFLIL